MADFDGIKDALRRYRRLCQGLRDFFREERRFIQEENFAGLEELVDRQAELISQMEGLGLGQLFENPSSGSVTGLLEECRLFLEEAQEIRRENLAALEERRESLAGKLAGVRAGREALSAYHTGNGREGKLLDRRG